MGSSLRQDANVGKYEGAVFKIDGSDIHGMPVYAEQAPWKATDRAFLGMYNERDYYKYRAIHVFAHHVYATFSRLIYNLRFGWVLTTNKAAFENPGTSRSSILFELGPYQLINNCPRSFMHKQLNNMTTVSYQRIYNSDWPHL